MKTTNILLALIAAILFFKFFPNLAQWTLGPAAIIAVVYACWRIIFETPGKVRIARQEAQQERDDQLQYNEFMVEHTAIRAKYDPRREWNEATTLPPEYQREMAELNERYKAVLARRFGEHILQR